MVFLCLLQQLGAIFNNYLTAKKVLPKVSLESCLLQWKLFSLGLGSWCLGLSSSELALFVVVQLLSCF